MGFLVVLVMEEDFEDDDARSHNQMKSIITFEVVHMSHVIEISGIHNLPVK